MSRPSLVPVPRPSSPTALPHDVHASHAAAAALPIPQTASDDSPPSRPHTTRASSSPTGATTPAHARTPTRSARTSSRASRAPRPSPRTPRRTRRTSSRRARARCTSTSRSSSCARVFRARSVRRGAGGSCLWGGRWVRCGRRRSSLTRRRLPQRRRRLGESQAWSCVSTSAGLLRTVRLPSLAAIEG